MGSNPTPSARVVILIIIMNKIRFEYPLVIYIYLPSEQELDLNVNFKEKGYLIDVEIYSDKPPSKSESGEWLWVTKGIRFIVEEGLKKKGTLSKLAENTDKYPELVSFLSSFINVVLDKIRNFGMTPHVSEIYPEEDSAQGFLSLWKTEISTSNGSWREVLPAHKESWQILYWILMAHKSSQHTATLEASKWVDIKLAIQENREPLPELEFMTNAIEFLRLNNLRLALLESITCLEIVVSQYLNEYLQIYKKVPPKRIDKFSKPPGIGLTARISVLLDLTLSPGDLSRININDILKAIEWRNTILHKTGHLPKDLNPEDVQNKIWNVLELADILSLRREQIKASPEMKKISEEIAKEYNIPVPKIWLFRNHNILMEFVFFDIELLPTGNALNELIKSISDLLSKRDRLFDTNKHLYINFIKFPREIVGRWRQGKYELVQKE